MIGMFNIRTQKVLIKHFPKLVAVFLMISNFFLKRFVWGLYTRLPNYNWSCHEKIENKSYIKNIRVIRKYSRPKQVFPRLFFFENIFQSPPPPLLLRHSRLSSLLICKPFPGKSYF